MKIHFLWWMMVENGSTQTRPENSGAHSSRCCCMFAPGSDCICLAVGSNLPHGCLWPFFDCVMSPHVCRIMTLDVPRVCCIFHVSLHARNVFFLFCCDWAPLSPNASQMQGKCKLTVLGLLTSRARGTTKISTGAICRPLPRCLAAYLNTWPRPFSSESSADY